MPMPPQTIIRTYSNQRAFERDAEKLAEQGYSVATVTESQPRSGCMRMLMLGFFALVWKPKPKLIVTYQWSATPAPASPR